MSRQTIKSDREISLMREAGRIVAEALAWVGETVPHEGVTTSTTAGDACAIRWKAWDATGCALESLFFVRDECWDDACADGQSCFKSLGAVCRTMPADSPGKKTDLAIT